MMKWMMLLIVMFQVVSFGSATANAVPEEQLKYFTPLTAEEEQNIHFIISTLSTKSMLSLLRYRKQLETAGAKTDRVHPLRFWKEVLSNPSLKSGLPNIGSIPRKQLISDFAAAFASAQQKGLMKEVYVNDFCKSTGISKDLFNSYAERGNWNELLTSIMSTPPRN